MHCRVLIPLFCLSLPVAMASAQANADSAERQAICWRARPEPRCSSFLTTTAAYEYPMFRSEYVHPDPLIPQTSALFTGMRLGLSAGWMVNRGDRAYGLAAVWGLANEHEREGVDLRHRRWLSSRRILDLGVGVMRVKGDGPRHTRIDGRGVSFAAEYGQPNFLAIHSRYEVARGPDGRHHAAFVGGRLGPRGAPIVLAVVAAWIALILNID